MNTISYFEIHSSEPEREVAFYQSIFGWKFTKMEGMPLTYYRIESETMRGGLLQRPVPLVHSSGVNAFCCSIEVADFDATSDLILAHGGCIEVPKFAVPNTCWQGYFRDPDQNVFGIFQVDLNAYSI